MSTEADARTRARTNAWIAGFVGLGVGAAAVALVGTGAAPLGQDRAAIEGIVRDYILANPQILPEAMQKLQQGEVARAVEANRALIETPYPGAWAGAENGDVVLVEFFDYACGYCRQSVADIDRLLAEDKRLKVVFRELPILGPPSEVAARASLVAAGQGKFMAFHRALFAAGRPSEATVAAAQAQVGISPSTVGQSTGVDRELGKNIELTRALGISGTPAFVVGGRIFSGAVGYNALKAAIAEARKG